MRARPACPPPCARVSITRRRTSSHASSRSPMMHARVTRAPLIPNPRFPLVIPSVLPHARARWRRRRRRARACTRVDDATMRVTACAIMHAYDAHTHHARAPHPNPPLPLVIPPSSPPSSPTRARGGGGCGGGRSRHVASRRMERGAPQRHQPPETVGPPKYPPDQTNRAWRVARDGVSALARGGRRSFPPTRDGRTGEWAGGQAGRRAGGRAGGGGGRTRTDERASWRWSVARDAHACVLRPIPTVR